MKALLLLAILAGCAPSVQTFSVPLPDGSTHVSVITSHEQLLGTGVDALAYYHCNPNCTPTYSGMAAGTTPVISALPAALGIAASAVAPPGAVLAPGGIRP